MVNDEDEAAPSAPTPETPSAPGPARDASGHFLPGNREGYRGGRPKGAVNVLSREVREAVRQAFHELGGVRYLKRIGRSKPEVFVTLLGKLIPAEVRAELRAPELEVWIRDFTGRRAMGALVEGAVPDPVPPGRLLAASVSPSRPDELARRRRELGIHEVPLPGSDSGNGREWGTGSADWVEGVIE